MVSLVITLEVSKKNTKRLNVAGRSRIGRFDTSAAVDKAAKYFGLDSDWLQGCLDQGVGEYTVPEIPPPPPPAPVPVFIRGLRQKGGDAWTAPNFDEALAMSALPVLEPLIYWEGTDQLCALDIDLHSIPDHAKRFSEQDLSTRFAYLAPQPAYIWVTHGRGLRLIYFAQGGYTADALAAVAAVRIQQLAPQVTVELKSQTRHPAYPNTVGGRCGPVEKRIQTTECEVIKSWSEMNGSVSAEHIEHWLEERGYTIGERYEHDRCPVDPRTPSHGTPVLVSATGIMCFGCHGHGVSRGRNAPGWFPFESLLGDSSQSAVSTCVENFTHWEHAKFILGAHHKLSASVLRGAYAALLQARHGADPRIAAVFGSGSNLLRYHKRWGTLAGETYKDTNIAAILAKLPSCQFLDPITNKPKVDEERVARMLQTMSLERYGYPHVHPVWGLPIYSQYQQPRYPYEITIFKGPGQAPRYLTKSQRISEEDAWLRLQNAFPGVNRAAIELLIAAKGCSEADGTWPPFIFIYGPTKSSKSTSVLLAAAIAGDSVHSVPCISDDQRIRAAISETKERGTYCVFNEAVKDSIRSRRGSKIEAMEFALGLTADSVSHKLYVGPVEMGYLPVLIWTDTEIPQELKQHAQLARRFIGVLMPQCVDWHSTMKETAIGKAEHLRCADRYYVEAADSILSNVIDRFFRTPATFEEIANQLGFTTLAESEDAVAQTAELLHFHSLVQQAPMVNGQVAIDLTSSSALSQAWRDLADPPDHRSSRKISEVDWALLLKVPGHLRCNVSARRDKVFVRFEGTANGSILRHRDSEPRELAHSRRPQVHHASLHSDDDAGSEAGGGSILLGASLGELDQLVAPASEPNL